MAAQDFSAKPSNLVLTTPTQNSILDKLPVYLRSDLLGKWLSISMDQLTARPQQQQSSGFIGHAAGAYYDPATDFYVPEPTALRSAYQLEPTVTSIDDNNNINYVNFYQDLVNALQLQGASTINASRLFAETQYSWAPPINIDMFVNFSNYYWIQAGPEIHVIADATAARSSILGQTHYTTPSGLVLSTGMKVILLNDADVSLNNRGFIIEGVGASIAFIDDSINDNSNEFDVPPWDTTPWDASKLSESADYFTISRNCQDGNAWSRSNRWFHKDVIGIVDVSPDALIQATRPIIEFVGNMQLMNSARWARCDVAFCIDDLAIVDLVGASSYVLDGVALQDGDVLVFVNDPDPEKNNCLYTVFGLNRSRLGLEILINGWDAAGQPSLGEGIFITRGRYAGQTRWYNGTTWIASQFRTTNNQMPEFMLYDVHGVALNDAGSYVNSNFTGSSVFQYLVDASQPLDPVLGINTAQGAFGELQFNNAMTTGTYSYTSGTSTVDIAGSFFYRIYVGAQDQGLDILANDWHASKFPSRQSVLDQFEIRAQTTDLDTTDYTRTYTLSIAPSTTVPTRTINGTAYQDQASCVVQLNGQQLVNGQDYAISGNQLQLSLNLTLADQDIIDVASWNPTVTTTPAPGYWQIANNFTNNANNQAVTTLAYQDMFDHFTGLISRQTSFVGNAFGDNNYRDTLRDLALGVGIVNHSASMLRLALLASQNQLNLLDAVHFNNREYTKFQRKFAQCTAALQRQGYTSATANATWISTALTSMNLGSTATSAFANSFMLPGTSYMPASAAALGIAPVYLPSIYWDDTRLTPAWVIQGHDGSIVPATNTYIDEVLLQLEQDIYANLDPAYKSVDYSPAYDVLALRPGAFRNTVYTTWEWNKLAQPAFERWATRQQQDYVLNTTFDAANAWTWNYASMTTSSGQPLPGSWRGIYEFLFDTSRPHTHPWELLAFSQQPSWWTACYGAAPYTSNNLVMWQDLAAGRILQGARAGVHAQLARPTLLNCLPVDSQGRLLDPVSAGICLAPNVIDAAADWKFGDLGPVEYAWTCSYSYAFDLAEAMFLAKPADFIEFFWEARKLQFINGQALNTDTGTRLTSADMPVHGDVDASGNVMLVRGISCWISDNLANNNINISSNFSSYLHDLSCNLAYKFAAFAKAETLKLTSEAFGVIPQENTHVQLYKNASLAQLVYSAVIVIWDGSAYRVTGYDALGESFPQSTQSGMTSLPYYSALASRAAVVDFFTAYQAALASVGWIFDEFDAVNQRMQDFAAAAQDFLAWSSVPLQPGQSIIFSPCSSKLEVATGTGFVDNTQNLVNGVHAVLDRTGHAIAASSYAVTRSNNAFTMKLKPNAVQGIHCLRLSMVEYEHVVILDNTTDFNDEVYNTITGERPPRLQLSVLKTQGWTGQPLAPGFFIAAGNIIDNAETSIDRMTHCYDFDLAPSVGTTHALAEHLLGYQPRTWLDNIMTDDAASFDFYRGMIGMKGTPQAFNNIMRSNIVSNSLDIAMLPEWAICIADYGNTPAQGHVQLSLYSTDIASNPQLVAFVATAGTGQAQVIQVAPQDARWVQHNGSNTGTNQFLTTGSYATALPTAGYVAATDYDHVVTYSNSGTGFMNLVANAMNAGSAFAEGDIIWTVIQDNGDWNVHRVSQDQQIVSIQQVITGTAANASIGTADVLVINGTSIASTGTTLAALAMTINANTSLLTASIVAGCLQLSTVNFANFTFSGSVAVKTGLPAQVYASAAPTATLTGTTCIQAGQDFIISGNSATSPVLTGACHATAVVNGTALVLGTSITTGIIWPSMATGTTANGTVAVSSTIVLAGQTVTFTGTSFAQCVLDINANGTLTSAGISAALSSTGCMVITSANGSNITIDGTARTALGLPTATAATGPMIQALPSIRFASPSAAAAFTPPLGWATGDLVYIDNNGSTLWQVNAWNGSAWSMLRMQSVLPDMHNIQSVWIYDNITHDDEIQLALLDPVQNMLFPAVAANLDYVTAHDPAVYDFGNGTTQCVDVTASWGAQQVGRIWWDLSTTRFWDYHQGSDEYQRQYWAQPAPGIVINMYQWVASPVPPDAWSAYCLAYAGSGVPPSGTVSDDQAYCVKSSYSTALQATQDVYYFWVLSPSTQVDATKTMTVQDMIAACTSPATSGIAWLAATSSSEFVISEVQPYLNNTSTVLQINFMNKPGESIIHRQWQLFREQDSINAPSNRIWNKMLDSLVGWDGLALPVPDPTLSAVVMYGMHVRPRQTWFVNRLQARLNFFEKVNALLLQENVTAITNWSQGLHDVDPLPSAANWDHEVNSIEQRNALYDEIAVGTRVLVTSDATIMGFWSLWTYQGLGAWQKTMQQQYAVDQWWQYVDWYASGYAAATAITHVYASIAAMNSTTDAWSSGDIIKVLNNGAGSWNLYVVQAGSPVLIGQQSGTIAFLPTLYNYAAGSAQDATISNIVRIIAGSLRNNILSILQQNLVVYTMLSYVHVEQTIVPWVFATSMVLGQGRVQSLVQTAIAQDDVSDDVLDYFQEIKPYHTQLRTIDQQLAPVVDQANTEVTELSRSLALTMKFDRVSGTSLLPATANVANYNIDGFTAADRLQLIYSPTVGMPPKVLSQLIDRTEFGGSILDGANFYKFGTLMAAGFDNNLALVYNAGTYAASTTAINSNINDATAPTTGGFDNDLLGFDADANAIEKFYDDYVNAGGNFAAIAQTASTINVDGNAFVQPTLADNHPQELIATRAGDAFVMDVFTSSIQTTSNYGWDVAGWDVLGWDATSISVPFGNVTAPKTLMRNWSGASNVNWSSVPLQQHAQSSQAVWVYKNGTLLRNVQDYVIDFVHDTLSLVATPGKNDAISVRSQSMGGSETLDVQHVVNTNATAIAFNTTASLTTNQVMISVNGTLVSSTVSGTTATIVGTVPPASTITAACFLDSTISTAVTQLATAPGGAWTWNLVSPASPTTPAYHATQIYSNGTLLMPPHIQCQSLVSNQLVYALTHVPRTTGIVSGWINGTAAALGTDYALGFVNSVTIVTAGTNYALGDTVVFAGTGTAATGTVTAINGSGAITGIAIVNPGYNYTTAPSVTIVSATGSGASCTAGIDVLDVLLLSTPVTGSILTLAVTEDQDYVLSGTTVQFMHSTAGDAVTAVTYANDASMIQHTQTYAGIASGVYVLAAPPHDGNSIMVWRNGQLQIQGRDYVMNSAAINNVVQYQVQFATNVHISSDNIVINIMQGIPVQPTVGMRVVKNVFGNYDYLRISDAATTVLVQNLSVTDTSVVVMDSTVLSQPNLANREPGRIIIGGECIAYWQVDASIPGHHVLGQCVRGHGGTGIAAATAGVAVRDASSLQRIPGGMTWLPRPLGLLYSQDAQALFLAAQPGSSDVGI